MNAVISCINYDSNNQKNNSLNIALLKIIIILSTKFLIYLNINLNYKGFDEDESDEDNDENEERDNSSKKNNLNSQEIISDQIASEIFDKLT